MSVVRPILELMYKCDWHGPARWMTGRNLSKYDISKYLDWTVITQEWHRIQRHTGGLYCEARFGAYRCKSRFTLWVFSVTRVCYDSLLTGELCFSRKSMAQPGVHLSRNGATRPDEAAHNYCDWPSALIADTIRRAVGQCPKQWEN